MRKLKYVLPVFLLVAFTFSSCDKEDDSSPEEEEEEQVEVNETSIIPATTFGRPNNYLGCVEIGSRITSIEVWDHGTVDGDIVSIIANGNTIIDEIELDGPDNPVSRDYNFSFNGFNYVTLYAHNEGDISPNTCTVAINGVEFVLEANLSTNGSFDVIVNGYGVDCSDAGGGGSGGGTGGGGSGGSGGSGGDPVDGDVKFFITEDFNCGDISVNVNGVGSSIIDGYFNPGSLPECSNTAAGGNFNDLAPGTYSFIATCGNLTWESDFTIVAGSCLKFQLY
ncbi:MAG: hypothetical protein CMC70_02435 [Flavobacteriaceae bacterium]|nr:hypothetical protein [Flavobacteriaceae bacterium]